MSLNFKEMGETSIISFKSFFLTVTNYSISKLNKCFDSNCKLYIWILMQLISLIISMFVPFINGSSLWRAPRQQCNYDGIIQKYLMNITRCQILQKLAFQCPGFTHNNVSSSRVSMTVHLILRCCDNSNDKKIHFLY